MIEITTVVDLPGVRAEQVFDFMIDCDDESYQKWWPGTHFQFHTAKHFPGYIGNIVFFDELIGTRRVKSHAVIRDVKRNSKLVWQLKNILLLPVWVELNLNENNTSVEISHTMKAGFNGVGRIMDFIFRSILNKKFERDLNDHAKKEFSLLAKNLVSV